MNNLGIFSEFLRVVPYEDVTPLESFFFLFFTVLKYYYNIISTAHFLISGKADVLVSDHVFHGLSLSFRKCFFPEMISTPHIETARSLPSAFCQKSLSLNCLFASASQAVK